MLMPVLPHFACECLSMKKSSISLNNYNWPKFDKELIESENCNIVIQINGKKRGVIKAAKDIEDNDLMAQIQKDEKNNKIIKNRNINKIFFVKNRLINILFE